MTIKEFCQWAKENNVEGYEVVVQYRDGGGEYYGKDTEVYCYIDNEKKEVVL